MKTAFILFYLSFSSGTGTPVVESESFSTSNECNYARHYYYSQGLEVAARCYKLNFRTVGRGKF